MGFGLLGGDFDPTQPADDSMVRLGASWIRDLKSRVKRFASVLFNLETGDLKDNVVRSDSLTDSGVTPGTYTRVTVNEKGLVTDADNEAQQLTTTLYQARFEVAGAQMDTPGGVAGLDGSGGVYTGPPEPYHGTYPSLNGSSYRTYGMVVPAGVTRMKAIVIGGGGGPSGIVTGFSVRAKAASAPTTTTGKWEWIPLDTYGNPFPPSKTLAFLQSFRVKDGVLDASEKLQFETMGGGAADDYMLPGQKFRNLRTSEVIQVVSLDSGSTWVVQRGVDATGVAAVNLHDEWRALVTYGGGGGWHVEGTFPVTPGETIQVVVGVGGAAGAADDTAGNPGGTSAVASGAGYIESGGGAGGGTASGGPVTSVTKSSSVGVISSSGYPGELNWGGRSGSYLKATVNQWYGDGGGSQTMSGSNGLVILQWVSSAT